MIQKRQDAFEMLYNWDIDKNKVAPILFIDFVHLTSTMNKSYFIKEDDIKAASLVRKPNSISCIEAIKLRWTICLPMDGSDWDIPRAKTPLRDFVQQLGLELYIDPAEVVEIRNHSLLKRA